jgi:acetoin utilization protein AcuB/CBS domain-containing protein
MQATPSTEVPRNREAQRIRYWMSAPAITIGCDAQVSEALARMHEHSIRRLPVVTTTGQLCGMITEGDIRGADILHAAGLASSAIAGSLKRTSVYEAMTEQPIRITVATTLREAALLMLDNKIGGLPVVDAQNMVIGVVTESDLFEALICYLDWAAAQP